MAGSAWTDQASVRESHRRGPVRGCSALPRSGPGYGIEVTASCWKRKTQLHLPPLSLSRAAMAMVVRFDGGPAKTISI